MKKLFSVIFTFLVFTCALISLSMPKYNSAISQSVSVNKYYTVYSDESKKNVLFVKGEDVSAGDMYLSHDNKLYEIVSVNDKDKTAIAKFVRDEKLPKLNVKAKSNANTFKSNSDKNNSEKKVANAADFAQFEMKNEARAKSAVKKKVGVYHTHNDESYYTPDGVDSVYGKGGIHDVGKALVNNLEKLGIDVDYREDLHLPHNSGAYTRSQVTASALLQNGVDAIFDIHRDSTARKYYLTNVNGEDMSYVRMVVGSSSSNYEENKKFAYMIKSYADEVYPNFIKDIYIGKGNYNQQLSTNAMLFEMGCENIEKDLAIKSTENLAKIIDVVLYGSENASEEALNDVDLSDDYGNKTVIEGLASRSGTNGKVNSNETLFVVLGIIAAVVLVFSIVMIFSKEARYKVGRFFSEMFAGIFGKKSAKKN